jgi:hypothetical protein
MNIAHYPSSVPMKACLVPAGRSTKSQPWLETRLELAVGPLFCVINGPTRGRQWSSAAARSALRD